MEEEHIREAITAIRAEYDDRHGPISLEEIAEWLHDNGYIDHIVSKSFLSGILNEMWESDRIEGTFTKRGLMAYSLRVRRE